MSSCKSYRWTLSILVTSVEWTMKDGKLEGVRGRYHNPVASVDLISILRLNESDLLSNTRYLNYPPSACFRFCGFYGKDAKNDLIQYLKTCAEKDGTELILDSGTKENRSK